MVLEEKDCLAELGYLWEKGHGDGSDDEGDLLLFLLLILFLFIYCNVYYW